MRLESNLSLLMGKHRYRIQEVHERTGLGTVCAFQLRYRPTIQPRGNAADRI
jgi:hypothetical protein